MGKLDADKTQKNENQEQAKERLVNSLVGGAIVIGAVVVLVYLFRFGGYSISKDPANWGALGDYLGGVLNPIFAFFAFVILVVSLKVQSKELKATTDEMRNANDAQERLLQQQNQANQLQNFENLFFQLLDLKGNAFNGIQINNNVFKNKDINSWLMNSCNLIEAAREVKGRNQELNNLKHQLSSFKERYLHLLEDFEVEELYHTYKITRSNQNLNGLLILKNLANQIGFCDFDEINEKINMLLGTRQVHILLNRAKEFIQDSEKYIELKKSELATFKLGQFPLKYSDYEENEGLFLRVSNLDSLNKYHESQTIKLVAYIKGFKNYFYGDWNIFMKEIGNQYFAHYLRNCYQILYLIDTHDGLKNSLNETNLMPTELQRRYAKIFRAHLTEVELEVLLFNGSSEYGRAKLKPLLEKYAMFAHLNCNVDDGVKNRTHIFDYAHHYQPCAFGKDEEWAEYFNLHNASLEQWKSKYHIDQYGINDYLKKAIWK